MGQLLWSDVVGKLLSGCCCFSRLSPVLRSTPTPKALVGRPSEAFDRHGLRISSYHSLQPEIASQHEVYYVKRLTMTGVKGRSPRYARDDGTERPHQGKAAFPTRRSERSVPVPYKKYQPTARNQPREEGLKNYGRLSQA